MKTLVERIRNRELAIENDGSLEQLRKVVKHFFFKDKLEPLGNVKYYFAEETDFDLWDANSETDLPTVSVKEVLAEIEGEGKKTLLEKAKRDYPVGAKYHPAWPRWNKKECIIKGNHHIEDDGCVWVMNQSLNDNDGDCLYDADTNKWAEIISKPEPKTKVIYLNEEDKPKIEEPLSFSKWFTTEWDKSNLSELISIEYDMAVNQYIKYLNNFKPNDKPIEFTHFYNQKINMQFDTDFIATDFDIVLYVGNGFFWCTDKGGEGTVSVFKGNLNNGKVN